VLYILNDRPQNAGGISSDAYGGGCDYAANAGTRNGGGSTNWWYNNAPPPADDAALIDTTKINWPDVNTPNFVNRQPTNAGFMNGVSFWTSMVKVKDITDGTAHTYLIGEKNVIKGHYYDGHGDYGNDTALFAGFDYDWFRWGSYLPAMDSPPGSPSQNNIFGSAHISTFNMSFCDGSVRSISYSIDAITHELLSNRMDGGFSSTDNKAHTIDGSIFNQ
jgi:prepilin-type processing-associated H-X9-DG protein